MGRFEERVASLGSLLTVELTGMTPEERNELLAQLQTELSHIEQNTTGLAMAAKVLEAVISQI